MITSSTLVGYYELRSPGGFYGYTFPGIRTLISRTTSTLETNTVSVDTFPRRICDHLTGIRVCRNSYVEGINHCRVLCMLEPGEIVHTVRYVFLCCVSICVYTLAWKGSYGQQVLVTP